MDFTRSANWSPGLRCGGSLVVSPINRQRRSASCGGRAAWASRPGSTASALGWTAETSRADGADASGRARAPGCPLSTKCFMSSADAIHNPVISRHSNQCAWGVDWRVPGTIPQGSKPAELRVVPFMEFAADRYSRISMKFEGFPFRILASFLTFLNKLNGHWRCLGEKPHLYPFFMNSS
jgi:hypothetical protein